MTALDAELRIGCKRARAEVETPGKPLMQYFRKEVVCTKCVSREECKSLDFDSVLETLPEIPAHWLKVGCVRKKRIQDD